MQIAGPEQCNSNKSPQLYLSNKIGRFTIGTGILSLKYSAVRILRAELMSVETMIIYVQSNCCLA